MNMLEISTPSSSSAADVAPDDVLGIRACAKELGVNASTISRQLGKGLFQNWGTHAAPKVSLSEVREARARDLDPAQRRSAPVTRRGQDATGYSAARALREDINRQRDQIALGEKLGTILDRDQVEDDFETFARSLRERLRQRAQTLVLELEQLPSIAAKAARMVEADEALLVELADEMESLADGGGD